MLKAIVKGDYVKTSFFDGSVEDCMYELIVLNRSTINQVTKKCQSEQEELPDWFFFMVMSEMLLSMAKDAGYNEELFREDI